MIFHHPSSYITIPDGTPPDQALARVTHLGIGAHPDDLEILALHGILQCYESDKLWFGGIVCAHGGDSPRVGSYAQMTDAELRVLRRREQEEAARIGRYGILVQLDYSSDEVKGAGAAFLREDLARVFQTAGPGIVYLHNPADRHPTHVAVSLAALEVLRALPSERRPAEVYGVEVWGSLDWLPGPARKMLDTSGHEALKAALLNTFRSQIDGGKRYDLAAAARRRANATFAESHAADRAGEVCFAMDLTPLVRDPTLDLVRYVADRVEDFRQEKLSGLARFMAPSE